MKNWALLLIVFTFLKSGNTQVEFTWKQLWKKEVKNSTIAIDQYLHLYYTDNQTIYKVDSTGKQIFSQSSKNWSSISAIDARNPMKVLLFSEDQQLIEYLDNTLTKQQESVDLNQEGFSMVDKVVSSAQPNKVWLFDSDNSKIVLFSKLYKQQQQIDNIFGLLSISAIDQLLEHNNQLFILDETRGVFVLDMYGTLLHYYDLKNVQYIAAENEYLYYLQQGKLFFYHLRTKEKGEIQLPISPVISFQKIGARMYLQTAKEIIAFSLST